MSDLPNLRTIELHKFNKNASEKMLTNMNIEQFLRKMGCSLTEVVDGEPPNSILRGFKTTCPECKQSALFVGLRGKIYPIYWKCYSKKCSSRSKKEPANLVSLVRRLLPSNSLGEAIKAISIYLGYPRSYDITNEKPCDVHDNEVSEATKERRSFADFVLQDDDKVF